MRDDTGINGRLPGYRVVIITLDSHAAGPARRAMETLSKDYPGLDLQIHSTQDREQGVAGAEGLGELSQLDARRGHEDHSK